MIELDPKKPFELFESIGREPLKESLKFRLRCKREKKRGMLSVGFGRTYYVDERGEYVDELPDFETEYAALVREFNELT